MTAEEPTTRAGLELRPAPLNRERNNMIKEPGQPHPESGRIYHQDDPAVRFMKLAHALRQQCQQFIEHYDNRLAGRDYLQQHAIWPSDPDRIARGMGRTIQSLDTAYTDVVVDRELHEWGLGERDENWQRKYGNSKADPNG